MMVAMYAACWLQLESSLVRLRFTVAILAGDARGRPTTAVYRVLATHHRVSPSS